MVDGAYSIKVLNSSGAQVYYRADSSDNESDAITPLDVLSDLRANTDNSISRVSLAGQDIEGDAGGGNYWLDTSDTTTPDDGVDNIVDSVSPRIGTWKLLLPGKTTSVIRDNIAALRANTRAELLRTSLAGHTTDGDGGGGEFWLDTSDTSTADDGGMNIVDSVSPRIGTQKRTPLIRVSVKFFGAVGDGVADDTAAITAARDYIAASPYIELVFPAGTYSYSVSPNWAIQDAVISSSGRVILNYTGTGKAVIIDADAPGAVVATPGLCYNVTMGYFLVQAPAAATDGIYIESIHHSDLGFKMLGGCTAGNAFNIGFSVVTVFRSPTVSVNVGGWFGGNKPLKAMLLRERGAGETPSYNLFENPILEGTVIGCDIEESLGCIFLGGTMEGCSDTGLILRAGATENKIIGTDFEVNTAADIVDFGKRNTFTDVDSTNIITFEAGCLNGRLIGGTHSSITVAPGALQVRLQRAGYNRAGFAGTLTVDDPTTCMRDLLNLSTSLYHDALPTNTPITVGASPYSQTNTTPNIIYVTVSGGTVSNIALAHAGVTVGLAQTDGIFALFPNDDLIVTYSSVPTMRQLTG
jgi:hypothetical protein